MITIKKEELLKNLRIDTRGNTVFIQNRYFNFCYTPARDVVKEEFKEQYRYLGGLQCEYNDNSEDYKRLEGFLCDIAEFLIKYSKQ